MTFPKPLIVLFLLVASSLFASNHIAARIAFDDGTGLVLALVSRSSMACLLMFLFARLTHQSFRLGKRDVRKQALLGILISAQSYTLYSAVAILPVAVALLMVNIWPILYIVMGWIRGRAVFQMSLVVIMLMILFGLSLVLNVVELFNSDSAVQAYWWKGISLALSSALFLCAAMWLTNYHMAHVSGSVRSFYTMLIVVVNLNVLAVTGLLHGSYHLPQTTEGYIGLMFLALFYGIASTILFAFAPRLDLANNSPILSFEPVASLLLGALLLQQYLSLTQLFGGLLVLVGIVTISIKKTA